MLEQVKEIVASFKTKKAFCQSVGIHPQFLTQIEKGTKQIPPSLALVLFERYDVPLHEMRPDIYPSPKKQTLATEGHADAA